jgi:hypothetical protein
LRASLRISSFGWPSERTIVQEQGNTHDGAPQLASNGAGPLTGHDGRHGRLLVPALSAEAFYGLPGRITKAIEPHTEAHPAALLVPLLVAAGNVVGRKPHFIVEGDRHSLNEYLIAVGATSKARKGTGWGRTKSALASYDPRWLEDQIRSGLSSGEGLISAVRDPSGTDPGAPDKRLVVVESEFASVLQVIGRENNILSPVIRDAWDTGKLSQLVKNKPVAATGAHISIIGHITADELRRYLTTTQMSNGFANRFLFCYVERTKLLPRGGGTTDELPELRGELDAALASGSARDVIGMADGAWMIWDAVYEKLSSGKPGLFGATIGRAEAHVRRLAAIEAVLDESDAVTPDHLLAAIAIWQYCEQSAYHIFGAKLGDPEADTVLRALTEQGGSMSQTDVSSLFGRHKDADKLENLRQRLEKWGKIRVLTEETRGRPVTVWDLLPSSISLSAQVAGLVDYLSIAKQVIKDEGLMVSIAAGA